MQMDVASLIRIIPDFPKKGIFFHDVTTLFADAEGFRHTVDQMKSLVRAEDVDAVAGIEARGFILGGAIAYGLDASLIAIRKPGKLPGRKIGVDYDLEYGTDRIEMHEGLLDEGDRVLIVDDLIATGGTVAASVEILRQVGATVTDCLCVVELADLGGFERIGALGVTCQSLVSCEGG